MTQLDEMVECCACGSGSYDPVILHMKNGQCETYCVRCWKVFVNTQPVDNCGDTPK